MDNYLFIFLFYYCLPYPGVKVTLGYSEFENTHTML